MIADNMSVSLVTESGSIGRPILLRAVALTMALCVLLASCGHKACDDATDASTLRNWINSQSGVYDFEFDKDRYVLEKLELMHRSPLITSDTVLYNACVDALRWWVRFKGPERFWTTIDTLYGVRKVLLSIEFGFTDDASYFARAIVATDHGFLMASATALNVPRPTRIVVRELSEKYAVSLLNVLECRFDVFGTVPDYGSPGWGGEMCFFQTSYASRGVSFANYGGCLSMQPWGMPCPKDRMLRYLDSVFRAEVPDSSSRCITVGEGWR